MNKLKLSDSILRLKVSSICLTKWSTEVHQLYPACQSSILSLRIDLNFIWIIYSVHINTWYPKEIASSLTLISNFLFMHMFESKESKQELELRLIQYENQFIEIEYYDKPLSRPCLQSAPNPDQTGADLIILKLNSISQFNPPCLSL